MNLANRVLIPSGMACLQCGTEHNESIHRCNQCGNWFCNDCFNNHNSMTCSQGSKEE